MFCICLKFSELPTCVLDGQRSNSASRFDPLASPDYANPALMQPHLISPGKKSPTKASRKNLMVGHLLSIKLWIFKLLSKAQPISVPDCGWCIISFYYSEEWWSQWLLRILLEFRGNYRIGSGELVQLSSSPTTSLWSGRTPSPGSVSSLPICSQQLQDHSFGTPDVEICWPR